MNLTFKFIERNNLFLKLSFMPYYFSGPVYLKEENLTYPLKFSNIKTSMGMELVKYFLKPYIEMGISYYNFSYEVFNYLDAFRYYILLKTEFKNLNPSIKIYYTDPLYPLSYKNWSNFSLNPGLNLNYKFLNTGFNFENRIFTTKNVSDTLHYRRKDYKINIFLELKGKFKNFKFYPFFEYEQRFLTNPYENDIVEILKEYKKFRAGIRILL